MHAYHQWTAKRSNLFSLDVCLVLGDGPFLFRALHGNFSSQELFLDVAPYGGYIKCYHVIPGDLLEIRYTAVLLAILQDEVGRQERSTEDVIMVIKL